MRGNGTIETVTRVLALQREGRDIVRMEVGDPDFVTPTHITDAAVEVQYDDEYDGEEPCVCGQYLPMPCVCVYMYVRARVNVCVCVCVCGDLPIPSSHQSTLSNTLH
jgi:hypothetical protein